MNDKVFPSDAADKVLVRMPDGMRDRLKEAAKANNRTMNAEIVARLQATFDDSVVTTIEASVHSGAVDADEIAEKVARKLQGWVSEARAEPEAKDSKPLTMIKPFALEDPKSKDDLERLYEKMYRILSSLDPIRREVQDLGIERRGNKPYGPQRSSNARKSPPKPPPSK